MRLEDKIESLDADTINDLIDKHIIGRHAERNRDTLKRRLIDGICYEPLSEEFDLSVRQTQNIVYKGINKLLLVVDTKYFPH